MPIVATKIYINILPILEAPLPSYLLSLVADKIDEYIKNNKKAEKQGLGLGLFISKNLLAKSNGQIKFSHRESGGGMVKIVLSKDQLDLLK